MWGIYYERTDEWLTRHSPQNYKWATWEKTNLKWKTKQEAEIEYKKIYQNRNSLVKLKEVKTPREPETYIPVKRQIKCI